MNGSRSRVTSIEAIPVGVPATSGYAVSPPTGEVNELLLVRLELEDGIVGWGEAFAYGCLRACKAAVEATVAPHVIGRSVTSPSDVTQINDALQHELRNSGRSGVTMFAISGVDIALWDALGRATGASIAELTGGRTSHPVPAYASLPRYESREELVARVEVALAQGYTAIKLHEEDPRLVVAAWELTHDRADLMLDVSCGWATASAEAMFQTFAPYGLTWIEEPIFPPDDFAGLAGLQALGLAPVAAGENIATSAQARLMLDAQSVDVLQPSVTKAGGLTELLRMIQLAQERRVDVHPHSPYFGPGFLATLQVIASHLDRATTIERYHIDLEASLYPNLLGRHAPELVGPEGAGLGLDPDADVISRYRLRVSS